MSLVDFSQLYCPFPSAINKHVKLAQKHITDWSKAFQIIDYDRQFDQSKYAWVAARAFPHVNQKHLFLASDWLCWVFLLDDAYDELIGEDVEKLRSLLDELIYVINQESPVTLKDVSPLALSLCDLWNRLNEQAPKGWKERYRKTLTDYFDAAYWEAKNRESNKKLNIEQYLEMRQYTSGCYTVFDIIEITEQLTLSNEVLNNSVFQRYYYLANITSCLMNDIFSYKKERELGDIHNLIYTIQNEKNITFEQAVFEAVKLYQKYMDEYIQLEKQLPSFGDEMDKQVQKYIQSLHSFLRGHYEWSIHDTKRYQLN